MAVTVLRVVFVTAIASLILFWLYRFIPPALRLFKAPALNQSYAAAAVAGAEGVGAEVHSGLDEKGNPLAGSTEEFSLINPNEIVLTSILATMIILSFIRYERKRKFKRAKRAALAKLHAQSGTPTPNGPVAEGEGEGEGEGDEKASFSARDTYYGKIGFEAVQSAFDKNDKPLEVNANGNVPKPAEKSEGKKDRTIKNLVKGGSEIYADMFHERDDVTPHHNFIQNPFVNVVPTPEDYTRDPEINISMWKRLKVSMCIYLGAVHVLTFYWLGTILFRRDTTLWPTYVFAVALYIFGGMGITAGAHRLWAHRSYKASLPARILLMLMNSVANQGTVFHWARDHRTHHIFSDTPADPYDAMRGFWFSHLGWLLLKKHSRVYEASKRFVNCDDLKKDPVLAFQMKLDPWWNIFCCFVLPTVFPLLWGESWFNAYLVAGVVKYVYTLHVTWCVNSIVHKWGPKPYQAPPMEIAVDPEQISNPDPRTSSTRILSAMPIARDNTTTESPLVSFLAVGEGWHSWHHAFPWDYATSELGVLLQYNPTKLFLDLLARFGFVKDRKRAMTSWRLRKEGWLEKAKEAGKVSSQATLKESLRGFPPFCTRHLEVVDPAPPQGKSNSS